MKKGHNKIKRASKELSIRLATVLCHRAIVTNKLESEEYKNQIFAVRNGEETFSVETYKELKRELVGIRNFVRGCLPLTTKKMRTIFNNPKIATMVLFECKSDSMTNKVYDRFRHREKQGKVIELFQYGNGYQTKGEEELEMEAAAMESKISIFLQETKI